MSKGFMQRLLLLVPWVMLSVLSQAQPLQSITGQTIRCEAGKAGVFPCQNTTLLSFLSLAALDGDFTQDEATTVEANDIWGWLDPETHRRYALIGLSNGVSVVDVTDPVWPVVVAFLPEPVQAHAHKKPPAGLAHEGKKASAWRDIKTYGPYALVVSDNNPGHGLQVFDLRQLRELSSVPAHLAPIAHYHGFGTAHNVVVNEATGFAYAVGVREHPDTLAHCDLGYHAVDLRDPAHPQFAGCFKSSLGINGRGYTHDAQCLVYRGPDLDYQGREICIGSDETGIAILDVTDKTSVREIATATYPDVAYTHQGWFDEAQRYFYVNDELDELDKLRGKVPHTRTLIFDLLDLDSPQLAGAYFATTSAIDHNLFVRGDRLYQANYTVGLRVLDISDRVHPVEVAFFDTYPQSDSAKFAGAWGVYPFLPGGILLVSSIGEGLFVVQLDELAAQRPAPATLREPGLSPAAPHPFRHQTQLELHVDRPQTVRVVVQDLLGRVVQTVFWGTAYPDHPLQLTVEGAALAAGWYMVWATGETFAAWRPILRVP